MGKLGAGLVLLSALLIVSLECTEGDFLKDIEFTWGADKAKVMENGNLLELTLDRSSGSGFVSKQDYLFGRIDMDIKLVGGNSAGTVTTFYLSSQGPGHDEVDFEFLGNVTGQPVVLHTNVFAQGKGGREQQFYLPFDPRLDFHTYSIVWTPQQIVFYVDGTAIREFKNVESKGVAFPNRQRMKLYSSLWNADDWATRGGLVKTDWNHAPFTSFYRNFRTSSCAAATAACTLDRAAAYRMNSVRGKYMIYDYCKDTRRYPSPPPECL